MIAQLKRFLVGLAFWRKEKPAPEPQVKPKLASRAVDIEETGRWYFKRDILDRLDDYFEDIRVFRKVAIKGTFKLYSRLGGIVVSKKGLFGISKEVSVLGVSGHERMAFGCLSMRMGEEEEDEDTIYTHLICFRKMINPLNVQLCFDDVYWLAFVYVDKQKRDRPIPFQCYVAVDSEGNVRVLKEKVRHYQRLPKRKGSIPKCVWKKSEWLDSWAADLRKRHEGKMKKYSWLENNPPQNGDELVSELFHFAYNSVFQATSDTRIRVSKGGLVGVFSVDLLRMPYFFNDRDVTALAADGKKKRIFHIVRVHERQLKNGRSTFVRTHFRGIRQFTWNGYSVNITMPGKHHADLNAFTAPGYDGGREYNFDLIDEEEMVERFDKAVNV